VRPSAINKETSILQQLFKRIGRWSEIGHDYQPLPVSRESIGRVLTDVERARLFAVASSNANWRGAYLFAIISINTSGGPKELLTLRLKDVDVENRKIRIQAEGAKNVHRVRVIPLNDEGLAALIEAKQRAAALGSVAPDHYLFPARKKRNSYDPVHHQKSFTKLGKGSRNRRICRGFVCTICATRPSQNCWRIRKCQKKPQKLLRGTSHTA